MEKLNELPRKKISETKDTKAKKSRPSAPVIVTPVPPQVMDPSALPNIIERQKSFTSSGKHKKESKAPAKAR